jgi:hypothetical protein
MKTVWVVMAYENAYPEEARDHVWGVFKTLGDAQVKLMEHPEMRRVSAHNFNLCDTYNPSYASWHYTITSFEIGVKGEHD